MPVLYTLRSIRSTMTATPQPYPAYKPSGVDWLGDVPAHWKVWRLKHWVKVNNAVLPETTDPDFEFGYIDIGSVDTGVLTEQPQRLQFTASPSRARRIVRSGDTIVSTVRTYLQGSVVCQKYLTATLYVLQASRCFALRTVTHYLSLCATWHRAVRLPTEFQRIQLESYIQQLLKVG